MIDFLFCIHYNKKYFLFLRESVVIMKDYSWNFDEAETFILSYKIKDGKIVAKLASGGKYIIPYSVNNENMMLARMEEQAKYARVKPLRTLDKIFGAMYPLWLLPLYANQFISYGGWGNGILFSCVTFLSIYYPARIVNHLLKRREIKKLKLFLENKEELNEAVEKRESATIGLSRSTVKEIEKQKKENREPFNINNIDKYSLADLRVLSDNIRRAAYFGFEEVPQSVACEKNPTLARTKNNVQKNQS